MFKFILALFTAGGVAVAAGRLQNADFATSAQITGAGGTISQLLNTSKIYDSTNAQLLDTTLSSLASGAGLNQLTGDVTAGPGSGSQAATIAANAVTNSKFRQSAGLSVVGRSANSAGDIADITASNDFEVLRRSGTSIGFGDIDFAALPQITSYEFLGNPNPTTGDVQGVTISEILDGTSSTQGSILYRNASQWVALPPGTAGHVLQTNGAGANPSWAAGGGGGGGSGSFFFAQYGSDCTWQATSAYPTLGEFAEDASCTFTTIFNPDGWTVSDYDNVRPGVTFTAPSTGYVETCFDTNMVSTASGAYYLLRITDGTNTHTIEAGNIATVELPLNMCLVTQVTASNSYTVNLLGSVNTGGININVGGYVKMNVRIKYL